jgi:hypothetical protein
VSLPLAHDEFEHTKFRISDPGQREIAL